MGLADHVKLGAAPRGRHLTMARTNTVEYPEQVNWANSGTRYPIYANDKIGDCGPAAYAHLVQVWSQQNGGVAYDPVSGMDVHGPRRYSVTGSGGACAPMQPDITAWLKRYEGRGISGAQVNSINTWWSSHFDAISASGLYTPTLSAVMNLYKATGNHLTGPEDGRNENEILDRVLNHGFDGNHGIVGWKQLGSDAGSIKAGVWAFGGLLMGIDLPKSAETQNRQWRVTAANADPGGFGQHYIAVTGYNSRGLAFISWGQLMTMTWGFYEKYVAQDTLCATEIYAALGKDWLPHYQGVTAPNGMDEATLRGLIGLAG